MSDQTPADTALNLMPVLLEERRMQADIIRKKRDHVGISAVRVEQVIAIEVVTGNGVDTDSPITRCTRYWTIDGAYIGELS